MSINEVVDNGFQKPWLDIRCQDLVVDGSVLPASKRVYSAPGPIIVEGDGYFIEVNSTAGNQSITLEDATDFKSVLFYQSSNVFSSTITAPSQSGWLSAELKNKGATVKFQWDGSAWVVESFYLTTVL